MSYCIQMGQEQRPCGCESSALCGRYNLTRVKRCIKTLGETLCKKLKVNIYYIIYYYLLLVSTGTQTVSSRVKVMCLLHLSATISTCLCGLSLCCYKIKYNLLYHCNNGRKMYLLLALAPSKTDTFNVMVVCQKT